MTDADYYADDPQYVECGQCGEPPSRCYCDSPDLAQEEENAEIDKMIRAELERLN